MCQLKLFFIGCLFIISLSVQAHETNFFVVAHEDDWQLFMNPNVYKSTQDATKKTVIIHTTAGDGGNFLGTKGKAEPYYLAREEEALRAIRFMSNSVIANNVNNEHDPQLATKTTISLKGHNLLRYYYKNTVAYFLRLPDGGEAGIGFHNGTDNYQSLQRFYNGGIKQIQAIDKSATYSSWNDLVNTLSAIVQFESYRSTAITFNIHDTDAKNNPIDHSDHIHTALAMEAVANTNPCIKQNLFLGYSSSNKPANVTGYDLYMDIGTWAVTTSGLGDHYHQSTWDSKHNNWIGHNYFRTLPNNNLVICATKGNLAFQASVTASSQNTKTGQTAVKTIDGVISGSSSGDYTKEWAAIGKTAYLNLAWQTAVTISHVILYDRPNTNDQITSAYLQFDNGQKITVPILNNNGTATEISFTPVSTKNLKLVVSTVSDKTLNVGLSEIQVY